MNNLTFSNIQALQKAHSHDSYDNYIYFSKKIRKSLHVQNANSCYFVVMHIYQCLSSGRVCNSYEQEYIKKAIDGSERHASASAAASTFVTKSSLAA
jgi:hypothetical protein